MNKLGFVDLEILFLGINGNGKFNETDIEKSDLKKLGVGRILDSLASLKDRKLIILQEDGSFSVTDLARHSLWDETIPLWIRILRILEIKSFSIEEMIYFLKKEERKILDELEMLRKNNLVLMSPQRIDSKIIKMYEILPEGVEKIHSVEIEGVDKHALKENLDKKAEVTTIINQITRDVNDLEISFDKKERIIAGLQKIIERID